MDGWVGAVWVQRDLNCTAGQSEKRKASCRKHVSREAKVSKHFLEILASCQPLLFVPNAKATLTAEKLVHMSSMSFLFIVSTIKHSFVVFAAELSWTESETCYEGSSTLSVRSALSQVREWIIWGRKAIINILRYLCHRQVLCCVFVCEKVPSEHGKGASCQLYSAIYVLFKAYLLSGNTGLEVTEHVKH